MKVLFKKAFAVNEFLTVGKVYEVDEIIDGFAFITDDSGIPSTLYAGEYEIVEEE